MAAYVTAMSGLYDAVATWGGAGFPGAGDTFTILNTHTVTISAATGNEAATSYVINVGGVLHQEGGVTFTTTGNNTINGELEIRGSGNGAAATEYRFSGIQTLGAAGILDVLGTTSVENPDITFRGMANTAYFNGGNSITNYGVLWIIRCTGTFSTVAASGIFYNFRWLGPNEGLCTVGNILFDTCTGRANMYTCNFFLTANIVSDNDSCTYFVYNSVFRSLTSSELITQNRAANSTVYGGYYYGITFRVNGAIGALYFTSLASSYFLSGSQLICNDVAAVNAVYAPVFLDNSICRETMSVNNGYGLYGAGVNTDETTALYFQATVALNMNIGLAVSFLSYSILDVRNVATLYIAYNFYKPRYWQSSRTRIVKFINVTTITMYNGASIGSLQYEPILYIYDEANYLFALQYDVTYLCPNYDDLYGDSTLWTPATNTLAAGGQLVIDTTGNSSVGMDMAISDLSGWTLATTGTAVINTEAYQISFDGGVLWSGNLTLAQLRANTYIINGNTYNTDGRYDIQIRILLTSNLGGTVTQVRVTGVEYNAAIASSWNVRYELQEQIEGAGFVTATDSLHAIRAALTGWVTTIFEPMHRLVKWIKNYLEAHTKIFKKG